MITLSNMTIPDYKATLGTLRLRYKELLISQRKTRDEIKGLAKTIVALSALCGEEPSIDRPEEELAPDAGKLMTESWLKYMPFVDAVRTALRMVAPTAFTTSELRELLVRAGYPVHTKTDFMVALNVALKRFRDSEEVEIASKDGRKAYKWAFKNEMSLPPEYETRIDWEALVREADRTQDEFADDHPLREICKSPLTAGEARRRAREIFEGGKK
jgi:hypothetical protein